MIERYNTNEHSFHIGLLDAYTGKGLGRHLLSFLIDLAKQKTKSLFSEVYVNNKKAINLYQKLGFDFYQTYRDDILRIELKLEAA